MGFALLRRPPLAWEAAWIRSLMPNTAALVEHLVFPRNYAKQGTVSVWKDNVCVGGAVSISKRIVCIVELALVLVLKGFFATVGCV